MNKIIIGIIVIFIIIGSIYYYYSSNNYKKYLYIERQDSNKPYNILDEDIIKPKDGYNYSMGFFIYLNDYTDNFKFWKHLLHKGSELRSTDILNYTDWDNLIQDIPNQSPGIWMKPQSTTLRLSFSIEISKGNCGLNTNNLECDKHINCKWNGKCILEDEHATKMNDSISMNNIEPIYNIEYIDIEIPYKKMTHLSFVLENKILNVYLNGKLRKIHKFTGNPIINNDNMFFNQQHSYDGSIFNFNYIPFQIESDHIESLSKNIPNVEFIPKNIRFNNYIRRFKFKDAIQSFFI
jgi:hypothetical protein